MKARPRWFLTIASVFVSFGFAWVGRAQIYEVGPDASKSPKAQTKQAPSAPTGSGQSLGWGSNIQNARLARAAQLALQRGEKAQAVQFAQRAAQSAPNDAQLWFLLGYAARLDTLYQLSLDAYNRGLRLSPGSLDGLSGIAQDYSLMGRTAEAERLLEKIVSANPGRRNEILLLGEIYMRARDYPTALDWLTKAENLHGDARSELLLALCYQQLKQLDQASHYLDLAKRRAPNNPDVLRSLAGYYREVGNYGQAIAALKSIRNPQPDVLAELGYTYQLDGKLAESAQLYTQAANAGPKDIGLQLSAAQAQVAVSSIDDANVFLKRAETLDNNSYRLHAIRGEIAQMDDRYPDAAREYQMAVSHLPATPAEGPLYGIQLHMDLASIERTLNDEAAARHELQIAQKQIEAVDENGAGREQYLRLRALIKLNAGDADGALADIKAALASNPSDRNNLQLNGDILMKLGKTEDAIAVYKKILDQDPKNRFALTSLGYAERAAGRDQDAEKYFQKLEQADPTLYVPYLALGDLYTSGRQFAKAQAAYEKGIALAPKNALIVAGGINAGVEAHDLKLAADWVARVTSAMEREPQVLREKERYLTFKGDYQQSSGIGQQAIQLLPRDRDVVVYLGYDLLYLGRYDDLLALTKKYMNVLPKEPDIPLLQGYVYKHNGQSEEAREDFSEAIKRDPKAETAYVNRGYMLNDLHLPDQAAADFESALKMEPDDGQAHLGLAYASLEMNKPETALHQAAISEKLMGDIRDVHVIRATAYSRQGQLTKASTEYRAALKFTPEDGSLHLGLGNVLMALRHNREAIDELNLAVKYSPNDPQPCALLARAYANLQDRDQAIHFAEMAEKRAQSSTGLEQSQVFVTIGEALSDLGDQSAAMDRFSRALQVKGADRVGVRLAIAQLMTQQNRSSEAERQVALAMMEAEAGETPPPTGAEYIAAADVFRSLHDYELSQNYLYRAKNAGAPDAQVRVGLANNYLAVGDTGKAQAELSAVSVTNADGNLSYQYRMAEANVYRQEHQGAQALTSFAQATTAAGDDQTAQEDMLQEGGDEGMRINPYVSLLSDFAIQPIYEDSTVYVLDSKLDAAVPVPPNDIQQLPAPRSSLETGWTNAFHLHLKYVPTPAGFFQVRNARGEISAPATGSQCAGTPAGTGGICTLIVNRDTTDYNLNIGLNPTFKFGRNLVALNGGIQETLRRDSLQPYQMDQNLFRVFIYGSTNAFFNAISVSGYLVHDAGPFTESGLYSSALTGAIDFRVGSPWGKTALVTGWGASDLTFTPQTYEAYFTSSYIGVEHAFSPRLSFRALVEDVRAWRITNTGTAIAQNLRPAGAVDYSPHHNWNVEISSAYSSPRGFHVYNAIQNGISVSYAMPFHRTFEDESGPLNLAYPIRFVGGVQNENFFNFGSGSQQLRPYFGISVF